MKKRQSVFAVGAVSLPVLAMAIFLSFAPSAKADDSGGGGSVPVEGGGGCVPGFCAACGDNGPGNKSYHVCNVYGDGFLSCIEHC